jgi:hypothetical protein
MAGEHVRELARVELTSSLIAWPRLTVPLLTLGVAWLLRGSPGIPAVLFGWMSGGTRLVFGLRRPRRLILGASEREAGPGELHLRWADIDQIEMFPERIGRRRVHIFVRGAAADRGEVQVLCTAAEGAAICEAALMAGGLHADWSASARPRGLREALLRSASGGILYGTVALAFGRTPSAALLAAFLFALFALLGHLVTGLATWPRARLSGVLMNGVALISFKRGEDGG